MKTPNLILVLNRDPLMFIASVLTTTTLYPFNSSLAMNEASLPIICPLPSIKTYFSNIFKSIKLKI